MDLIDRTLGQYRILEPIGTGGMATVYKAYQPALQRYVALKVLTAQQALAPGFAKRCARKRRTARRFNHWRIVQALRNAQSAHEGARAWL